MERTLAQTVYEAFRDACDGTEWKSSVTGVRFPDWERVDVKIREAWQTAGEAARAYEVET